MLYEKYLELPSFIGKAQANALEVFWTESELG